MKRQIREVYGRGPSLSTAGERATWLARALLVLFVGGTLVAWWVW